VKRAFHGENNLTLPGETFTLYNQSLSPGYFNLNQRQMKTFHRNYYTFILLIVICGCQAKKDEEKFQREFQSLNLNRGEITLCGAEDGQFGKVQFSLSCAEKVQAKFNLAMALLHSFEYDEAEKVFVQVIGEDPECVMGYWGVAMSNFHPLWAPPTNQELEKGSGIISLARSLESKSTRESNYLEAIAVLYDDWRKLDHATRMLKFEKSSEALYLKYPEDKEAAIFYALALRAAADPTDKSFGKQRKAGTILNSILETEPNHPGVTHYLIHVYDYPELATLALPAARKYASIAATSAHALHMPSHIFTRLGLWNESIQSNINSIAAAKCYAENSGMKGHWDEELHGIDYLVYAYLQQGQDDIARVQLDSLSAIKVVFPLSNKNAYTFAAVPSRYALERKDWAAAATLELKPENFPWKDFPWERALVSFTRVLGAAHLHKTDIAKAALTDLEASHVQLIEKKKNYEANQVQIQIKASQGWIKFSEGRKEEAIALVSEAAAMEDATEKHPVTPGEVVPARELLGDLYFELGQFAKALEAYEADLTRHPGRFNGLYGAGLAAKKSGDIQKATLFFKQLTALANSSENKRPAFTVAKLFIEQNI
jgi:tetratricopeptide (TPR) repeat protein